MSGPARYRHKPNVIEAMRWEPGNQDRVGLLAGWLQREGCEFGHDSGPGETATLAIPTLEGVMTAQPGDWIIKGVNDAFYVCQPDVFEKSYEPADGGAP